MTNAFSPQDRRFMRLALRLAARARGLVEPNPLVGAVIVKNNQIIAQGHHKSFGGPHAEIHALRAAGPRAKNATLYVTLEPCCHFGKTPPCTDAILSAGISRVIAAMPDPFPQVHGKGIKLLRIHGVKVDVGLLQAQARQLNAPFLKRLSTGQPYVIAKWAQSLDGCIATASGESQWISSETSRAWVHTLRGRVDAILIGLNTALRDDPLLLARPEKSRDIRRIATRIVLDSHCRLPLSSQLVKTIPFAPVLVVHLKALTPPAARRLRALQQKGVMTLALPADKTNRPSLRHLLRHLARQDYTNIMIEGGPELLASFLHQNLIDEAHVFLAPTLIGGPHAKHAIAGPDLQKLSHAKKFHITQAQPSGPDLHLTLHHAIAHP